MNPTLNIIFNRIPPNWRRQSFEQWMYKIEQKLKKSRL